MNDKQLKKLADDIWSLEQECQNDNNVSENMAKMTKLIDDLPFEDLIKLMINIEKNH